MSSWRDYSRLFGVSIPLLLWRLFVRLTCRDRKESVTRMKTNTFFRSIALLAGFALAIPAFAKPVSKTISISKAAKIGKADLTAGEYRLLIDGNNAKVQRKNQVVAETVGRWEDREVKSPYDAVLLGAEGQVREVRFAGEKRVFVVVND